MYVIKSTKLVYTIPLWHAFLAISLLPFLQFLYRYIIEKERAFQLCYNIRNKDADVQFSNLPCSFGFWALQEVGNFCRKSYFLSVIIHRLYKSKYTRKSFAIKLLSSINALNMPQFLYKKDVAVKNSSVNPIFNQPLL